MSIMNDKFKAYEVRIATLEDKNAELQGHVALLTHQNSQLQEHVALLTHQNSELERKNVETEVEMERLHSELDEVKKKCQQAYDIAVHALERTQTVHQENAHLKKTNLELLTHLNNQYALDDNINLRCFFDSCLAMKGFQGRGRKKFIRSVFGFGSEIEALYERFYRPGRPNIHSSSHERAYAAVAASLLRKKMGVVADSTLTEDKLRFTEEEWKLIETLWKDVTGDKISMTVTHFAFEC